MFDVGSFSFCQYLYSWVYHKITTPVSVFSTLGFWLVRMESCSRQKSEPEFVNNLRDASIVVNSKSDTFYKVIKKNNFISSLSKFLPPKSVTIDIKNYESSILSLSFSADHGKRVIILNLIFNSDNVSTEIFQFL